MSQENNINKCYRGHTLNIKPRYMRCATSHLTVLALSMVLSSVGKANVVGGSTQNFNPTSNGGGFITVQGSETLTPWTLNIGASVNHAINTLPIFKKVDGDQSRTILNDKISAGELHLGYGVLKNWELGLVLPGVLAQSIQSTNDYRGEFASTGITSIDINTKYRIWHKSNFGIAAIGSVNINQLQNNPYAGSRSGPTVNIEFAGDLKLGKNVFAINIGHRFRQPGKPLEENGPIKPVKNQLILSGAASFGIDPSKHIITELFGSIPTQSSIEDSDRLESSAEAIIGYKHTLKTRGISLNGGVGTELIHGHSSPDWRIFAGINWSVNTRRREKRREPEPAKFIEGPLGPVKQKEIITVHDILFKFNSDRLVLKGQNTSVFQLKAQLDAGSGFKRLIIVGYTDSIGSDKYNRALSRRRATTIKNWLVKNYNIDPGKISVIGNGEANPIATNATDRGRQKNRRVEFRIFR